MVGLDYAGAKAALELFGLWDQEILAGLQIIERELLQMTAKRSRDSWHNEAEDLIEDGIEDESGDEYGD